MAFEEGKEPDDDTEGNYDDTERNSPSKKQTLTVLQKGQDPKIEQVKESWKEYVDQSNVGSEVLSIERESWEEKYDAKCNEHELLEKKYQRLGKRYQHLRKENQDLVKKHLEESNKKKQLYDEVVELRGNFWVFCRCRPFNANEISNGLVFDLPFDLTQENELQIISSEESFKFDHVFRLEDSQESVFAETMPFVTSVLNGLNVCIVAYGQTGTGKTFTMEGTPNNRGVNYRILEELFKVSNEKSSSNLVRYELFVSMLEVYNEEIRDLLIENSKHVATKLEISAGGTFEVPKLDETHVHTTEQAWFMLQRGSQVRSYRSDCLVRVTVELEDAINNRRTRSYLWLVDLAGREPLEVKRERLKQPQLNAVDIISLASKTSGYILRNSLGRNYKILMFVQISPNPTDLSETLYSLDIARHIRIARHVRGRGDLFKYKQLDEHYATGQQIYPLACTSIGVSDGKYARDFEQIELLGEGGQAKVFKCRSIFDGKTYAIKQVRFSDNPSSADEKEGGLNELRILCSAQHKNVVRYYQAWIENANPSGQILYIAMDYYKRSLEFILQRERCLSLKKCWDYLQQLAEGLHFIHENGIIHRDLKPNNILVDNDGQLRISDFGLAVTLNPNHYYAACAPRGRSIYAAPEVIKETRITPKSDIYSLGVIFFEMIHYMPDEKDWRADMLKVRKKKIPESLGR